MVKLVYTSKVLRDLFLCGKKPKHCTANREPLVSFFPVADRKTISSFGIFPEGRDYICSHKTTHIMTEQQSALFREVLDLNWEFGQETDWTRKWELAKALSQKKHELKESMGHKEYDTFIENGRKMFAPLKTEEVEELED